MSLITQTEDTCLTSLKMLLCSTGLRLATKSDYQT